MILKFIISLFKISRFCACGCAVSLAVGNDKILTATVRLHFGPTLSILCRELSGDKSRTRCTYQALLFDVSLNFECCH